MDDQLKKKYIFDLDKTFLSQNLVITFFISIVCLSTLFFIFILKTTPGSIVYKGGYEGLNSFFEIFRIPILVLTSLFPVLGILLAIYRSEQNQLQIEQTKKQISNIQESNNFNNYYKHLEQFKIHCSEVMSSQEPNTRFCMVNKFKLHSKLFPNLKSGKININQNSVDELEKALTKVTELLKMSAATKDYRLEQMAELTEWIVQTGNSFCIIPQVQSYIIVDSCKIFSGTDIRNLVIYIKILTELITRIFEFDPNYSLSDKQSFYRNICYQNMPSPDPKLTGNLSVHITEPFNILLYGNDFKEMPEWA